MDASVGLVDTSMVSSEEWVPRAELTSTPTSFLQDKLNTLPQYQDIREFVARPYNLQSGRELQEVLIVEDLIHVLTGVEGLYIRFNDFDPTSIREKLYGPNYKIHRMLDPALRELCVNLVALAKHHYGVASFAAFFSGSEHGRVSHALASAFRAISLQFTTFVADIEAEVYKNKEFTLQLMSRLLQPYEPILAQAYDTIQQLINVNDSKKLYPIDEDQMDLIYPRPAGSSNDCSFPGIRGGAILRVLAQRLLLFSGNPALRKLLEDLLKISSRPYIQMLNTWMHRGNIDDPFNEFMIQEQKTITAKQVHSDHIDEYWEKRYRILKNDLPLQLSNPDVCQQLLLIGKYSNVVRECGGEDFAQSNDENFDSIEDKRILAAISENFKRTNERLLQFLLGRHNLKTRILSLRHYFFGYSNDFLCIFLETAANELSKPVSKALVTKLQYSLDMALAYPGSISSQDLYVDEVRIELSSKTLTDTLLEIVNEKGVLSSGKESLKPTSSQTDVLNVTAEKAWQLDFHISFPLSLVISRGSITRYQFLMRNLVELKSIEKALGTLGMRGQRRSLQFAKDSTARDSQILAWEQGVKKLRFTMLCFVTQYLQYCCLDVIEERWREFLSNMDQVSTVDGLMKIHIAYLDACMKDLLLTNAQLLLIRFKILECCNEFCTFLRECELRIYSDIIRPKRRALHNSFNQSEVHFGTADGSLEWMSTNLTKAQTNFQSCLAALLHELAIVSVSDNSALRAFVYKLELLREAFKNP